MRLISGRSYRPKIHTGKQAPRVARQRAQVAGAREIVVIAHGLVLWRVRTMRHHANTLYACEMISPNGDL